MPSFKVLSPIKAGGKRHGVGAIVEMSNKAAATAGDAVEQIKETAAEKKAREQAEAAAAAAAEKLAKEEAEAEAKRLAAQGDGK